MLQNIDLRELAQMRGNGRDFVSVYFRTADGLDSLKARQRNLKAMLADVPEEAEAFELSMRRIHELIEAYPPDSESACIFACELLDFVRGHPLSMPVENAIHVGPAPYIRPLAELQDEYQNSLDPRLEDYRHPMSRLRVGRARHASDVPVVRLPLSIHARPGRHVEPAGRTDQRRDGVLRRDPRLG